MQIQYFNAKDLSAGVKATVHSTGRLGFSRAAEKVLDLGNVKAVTIGRSDEYGNDKILYVVPDEQQQPGSFAVRKSGLYYYVHTQHLFKLLGEDFEKSKIVYDITLDTMDGKQVFKLKRRLLERKKRA